MWNKIRATGTAPNQDQTKEEPSQTAERNSWCPVFNLQKTLELYKGLCQEYLMGTRSGSIWDINKADSLPPLGCGVMDNSLVKMRSMIFSLDLMCLKIPLRGCPETAWWCLCFWRSETETGRDEIRPHLSSVNKLGGHSMVTMMLTRLMATQTHSLAMVMVMTLTSLLMVDSLAANQIQCGQLAMTGPWGLA